MGTHYEMGELLNMAVAGDVVPHIEVFDFDMINEVIEKLANFEVDGRAVLKIPP